MNNQQMENLITIPQGVLVDLKAKDIHVLKEECYLPTWRPDLKDCTISRAEIELLPAILWLFGNSQSWIIIDGSIIVNFCLKFISIELTPVYPTGINWNQKSVAIFFYCYQLLAIAS